MEKSQDGQDFEISGMGFQASGGKKPVDGPSDPAQQAVEIGLGEGPAADPDPLADIRQMGDVYNPTRRPSVLRMDASMAQTDPLPLVPATWMEGNRRWGSPQAARTAATFCRPSLTPNRCRF